MAIHADVQPEALQSCLLLYTPLQVYLFHQSKTMVETQAFINQKPPTSLSRCFFRNSKFSDCLHPFFLLVIHHSPSKSPFSGEFGPIFQGKIPGVSGASPGVTGRRRGQGSLRRREHRGGQAGADGHHRGGSQRQHLQGAVVDGWGWGWGIYIVIYIYT